MKSLGHWYVLFIGIFLITNIFTVNSSVNAQELKWYKHYFLGLNAMKQGHYQEAVKHFLSTLRAKSRDTKKQRASGTIFIQYYPHRELGICLYQLGHLQEARKQLQISISQSPTHRAREYLNRINSGQGKNIKPQPLQNQESFTKSSSKSATQPEKSTATTASNMNAKIGDRMSIAVLPFNSQGIGTELTGVDLLDKLITAFVNSNRFKVVERAQLEKILQEQKLGLAGIVDPTTAAEIGKGIGVDAVVLGSITRAGNSLSIDARLIDTESATIISAQTAYSDKISMYYISEMVNNLSRKFKSDLPVVNGLVINIQSNQLTLDFGTNKGVKKGMKCIVYREGNPIVHPVTGKVIGRMVKQICFARITQVMPEYSLAEIEKSLSGVPQKLDKVITK